MCVLFDPGPTLVATMTTKMTIPADWQVDASAPDFFVATTTKTIQEIVARFTTKVAAAEVIKRNQNELKWSILKIALEAH